MASSASWLFKYFCPVNVLPTISHVHVFMGLILACYKTVFGDVLEILALFLAIQLINPLASNHQNVSKRYRKGDPLYKMSQI